MNNQGQSSEETTVIERARQRWNYQSLYQISESTLRLKRAKIRGPYSKKEKEKNHGSHSRTYFTVK